MSQLQNSTQGKVSSAFSIHYCSSGWGSKVKEVSFSFFYEKRWGKFCKDLSNHWRLDNQSTVLECLCIEDVPPACSPMPGSTCRVLQPDEFQYTRSGDPPRIKEEVEYFSEPQPPEGMGAKTMPTAAGRCSSVVFPPIRWNCGEHHQRTTSTRNFRR